MTTAARSERGVVAASHPLEVEAGCRMIEAGGNAVDAVIAAAFAGFVVEPTSCGLGGYGHLSMYLDRERLFLTVDHGPRAPSAARADMFTVRDGEGVGDYDWPVVEGRRNEVGGLAPAVPGAVAGLCAAHERAGRLPLAQVLEPAIEIADKGLEATWNVVLPIVERLHDIRCFPEASAFLLRDGDPPSPGDYWRSRDHLDTSALASTLRRIARQGATGFHAGDVPLAVENAVRAAGGILTASDLENYQPKVIVEPPATYHRYQYVTANDQVGYEALNILESFQLGRLLPESAEYYHLMAESFACAFVDNVAHYGDSDHTSSPLQGLASREFAAERSRSIHRDRAAHRPVRHGDPWPFNRGTPLPGTTQSTAHAPGTAQMAAADSEGNLAALITTVGHDFGSLIYVPEVGIFLNSSMVNFDPRPGRHNSIAPGKMPFFAVPSIVATHADSDGFAACGSGGYRILSGVVHTFVNVIDFGMTVESAVAAPRVYSQGGETFVDDQITPDVRMRMAALGHEIVLQHAVPGFEPFARVSAVTFTRDGASVVLEAASDPPWSTAAGGV